MSVTRYYTVSTPYVYIPYLVSDGFKDEVLDGWLFNKNKKENKKEIVFIPQVTSLCFININHMPCTCCSAFFWAYTITFYFKANCAKPFWKH